MKKFLLLVLIINISFIAKAQLAPTIQVKNETSCDLGVDIYYADCKGGCGLNYSINYSTVDYALTTTDYSFGTSFWTSTPPCNQLEWVAVELNACDGSPVLVGLGRCGYNSQNVLAFCDCNGQNVYADFTEATDAFGNQIKAFVRLHY